MKLIEENCWIEIVDKDIPQSDIEAWLVDPKSGAICTFSGTTREWTGEEQTIKLFYECYPEMALSEMKKLVDSAKKNWQTTKLALVHRIGEVGIGSSSVFVGVSSPHRVDAFEACRYLIDTLKEEVPIWKKDYKPDGDTQWLGDDPIKKA